MKISTCTTFGIVPQLVALSKSEPYLLIS